MLLVKPPSVTSYDINKQILQPEDFIEVSKIIKLLPIVKVCIYDPNDTKTGILYWMGSMNQATWINPVQGTKPLARIEPKNLHHLNTFGGPSVFDSQIKNNNAPSCVTWTFMKHKIFLSDILIRTGNVKNDVKEWKLEGSTDGLLWEILHEEKNVPEWTPRDILLKHIKTVTQFYSQLKLTFNCTMVSLSAVEFFGVVMETMLIM